MDNINNCIHIADGSNYFVNQEITGGRWKIKIFLWKEDKREWKKKEFN